MCFLLGTPKPGQVLLLVRHYNIKKQLIPDKPALVAGCLRVPTDASGQTRVACALHSRLGRLGGAQRAAAWGPHGDPGFRGGPTRGARLPVAPTG